MPTVENTGKGFKSDEKRFYFPARITDICPECKKVIERDFNDDYLSYPGFNQEIEIDMYCSHDDTESEDKPESEWTVKAKLRLTLELV